MNYAKCQATLLAVVVLCGALLAGQAAAVPSPAKPPLEPRAMLLLSSNPMNALVGTRFGVWQVSGAHSELSWKQLALPKAVVTSMTALDKEQTTFLAGTMCCGVAKFTLKGGEVSSLARVDVAGDMVYTVYADPAQSLAAISTNAGVFVSRDSGKTFARITEGLPPGPVVSFLPGVDTDSSLTAASAELLSFALLDAKSAWVEVDKHYRLRLFKSSAGTDAHQVTIDGQVDRPNFWVVGFAYLSLLKAVGVAETPTAWYVATAMDGLVTVPKPTNPGEWSKRDLKEGADYFHAFAPAPEKLPAPEFYAIRDEGLVKSTDLGTTWTVLSQLPAPPAAAQPGATAAAQ